MASSSSRLIRVASKVRPDDKFTGVRPLRSIEDGLDESSAVASLYRSITSGGMNLGIDENLKRAVDAGLLTFTTARNGTSAWPSNPLAAQLSAAGPFNTRRADVSSGLQPSDCSSRAASPGLSWGRRRRSSAVHPLPSTAASDITPAPVSRSFTAPTLQKDIHSRVSGTDAGAVDSNLHVSAGYQGRRIRFFDEVHPSADSPVIIARASTGMSSVQCNYSWQSNSRRNLSISGKIKREALHLWAQLRGRIFFHHMSAW